MLRRGGCGEKQLGGGRQSSWATGDDPVEHGLIGFCRIAHHFEAVAIGFHLRAVPEGGFRADERHGGIGGICLLCLLEAALDDLLAVLPIRDQSLGGGRSEAETSEIKTLMRIWYAGF